MNKIFLVLFCTLLALSSYSQLGVGSSGQLFVAANTIFHVDSLIIIPATGNDLTLSNNSIVRVATPVTTVSGGNSIARVFNIGTAFPYIGNLGLIYRDAELNGNTENLLQVAYRNTTNWNVTSSSTFGSDSNYVTNSFTSSINVNNVTATTLGNTLPIKFSNFSAQLKNQFVAVSWQTDFSTSITGFYVQSSTDGTTWTTVGYVPAQSDQAKYTYNDANIDFTVRYYRVLGVETSGEKTYTQVAIVKKAVESIKLAITGSTGARIIHFINDTPGGIEIYDLKGQLLRRIDVAQKDYPANGIPAGVYILRFTIAGEQYARRAVL